MCCVTASVTDTKVSNCPDRFDRLSLINVLKPTNVVFFETMLVLTWASSKFTFLEEFELQFA